MVGRQEKMETSQSSWYKHCTQRRATSTVIVLTLLIFAFYTSTQVHSIGKVHIANLHIPDSHTPLDSHLPNFSIKSSATPLDPTRVALLIETRPLPVLSALLIQFISNLPAQWVILFAGNAESFSIVNKSRSLAEYIRSGKLVLTDLPSEYQVANIELLSATLTNPAFYSEFLAPAEWLLVFQADSMICSASEQSLDDWVEKGYDWIGAPWNPQSAGGNGGLSLRHIPPIIKLLENETREAASLPEDRWLCDRLTNLAYPDESQAFSVESVYYPRPYGYHLRGSGELLDGAIWQNEARKKQIYEYCPEIKIIMNGI